MSQNGGAALYIRSHFEYEQINDLSVSSKDICESIFIEQIQPLSERVIVTLSLHLHTPSWKHPGTFL